MLGRKTPILFRFALPLFTLSLIILSASKRYCKVADFVNGMIGTPIRFALARISGILSLSVAELVVFLSLAILVFLVSLGVSAVKRGHGGCFILKLVSWVMLFSALYTLTLGVAYHTSSIGVRMGFDTVRVTEDDLYHSAVELIEELNGISAKLQYDETSSVMPYDKDELSTKISSSYDAFLLDYPIFKNYETRAKRVLLGDLMASAGILGVYTYFTGEANVSFSYPDYLIPETVAHEFAHQRGIAREDEAGFVAYLVCSYSDDDYIRYSGALGIAEYLISALAKTDRARAISLYEMMADGVLADINAYREFYKKYQNSPIRKIASFVNDLYLKSNGTSGIVSYSGVVVHYISYQHSQNTDN